MLGLKLSQTFEVRSCIVTKKMCKEFNLSPLKEHPLKHRVTF
ncbi:hypothetical protein KP509_23G069200 [Ceratopteris richardii]|uniref:Uncharacterized protein n=1 Tax=Ceratopteris richardii TaxID=49495 RepID=A0A8T2S3Z9_CERRI|nr:hypothetical protein KP509_23G069200 [Ceratopteris richardii]